MYAGTLGSGCRGSVPREWRRGRSCPHTARMAEWVVGRLGAQRVDFGWPSVCLGESSSYTCMAEPAKHIGTRTIGIENDGTRLDCDVPRRPVRPHMAALIQGGRYTGDTHRRVGERQNVGAVRLSHCDDRRHHTGRCYLLRVVRPVRRIMHEPKMLRCGYDRRRSESTAGGRSGNGPRSEARMRRRCARASAGTIRTACADSQELVPARRLPRSNSTTTEALVVRPFPQI
jgi:hypothetical protein